MGTRVNCIRQPVSLLFPPLFLIIQQGNNRETTSQDVLYNYPMTHDMRVTTLWQPICFFSVIYNSPLDHNLDSWFEVTVLKHEPKHVGGTWTEFQVWWLQLYFEVSHTLVNYWAILPLTSLAKHLPNYVGGIHCWNSVGDQLENEP